MNIDLLWTASPWRRARRAARPPRRAAAAVDRSALAAVNAAAAGLADEPPTGCGWFDSSHELRAGLAIIEHEVVDVTHSLRLLLDAPAAA